VVFCFSNFIIGPYNADRDTVLAAKSPFGSQERIELYQKTFATSPMGNYQIRLFFAQKWLEFTESDAIKQLNAEQINREFSLLTEELEKSRRKIPFDYKSRLVLGQLYNRWSVFDKTKLPLAEKTLEEALALAPQNQKGYWNLAQTRLNQGRTDDALELARKAYDLYPENPGAKSALDEMEEIQKQAAVLK
jgi:tetratricopeptide (TPR) repeat protein